MDQTLHRVATKEREEIEWTTKQKMARPHKREAGNHLDYESNRQTTMKDIDGGLTVDGQSLDDTRREDAGNSRKSENNTGHSRYR